MKVFNKASATEHFVVIFLTISWNFVKMFSL